MKWHSTQWHVHFRPLQNYMSRARRQLIIKSEIIQTIVAQRDIDFLPMATGQRKVLHREQ